MWRRYVDIAPPAYIQQLFKPSKLIKYSLISQCICFVIVQPVLAAPSELKTEIQQKISEIVSHYPEEIWNTDGYNIEFLDYKIISLPFSDHILQEQGIDVESTSLVYSGYQAVISAPSTNTDYSHHRTNVIFNFTGETNFSFDNLKVIYKEKDSQFTSGGGNPIVFSVNKDELGGSSDKATITGNNIEAFLKGEAGRFVFVEKGASLEFSSNNLFLGASTNTNADLIMFDIAGTANLGVTNDLIGIVDKSDSSHVIGVQAKNGGNVTLNSKNALFINKSDVQNSFGLYAFGSSSSIKTGENSEALILQGFQKGVFLDYNSSLTSSAEIIGVLDSDIGIHLQNASAELDIKKLYIDSKSTGIYSDWNGEVGITTEQLQIKSDIYAIDNSEGYIDITAKSSHITGAISNSYGTTTIDFGQNAYFKGLTFNYNKGGEYCGDMNFTFGENSLWDVSYDKSSLNPDYGMNYINSLNLNSATINLASAENTSNFLKVDKLKGTGSFNLLINTDSHKSTEIHSGTDSEGVFNISVELAQGSFDQIGNNGILFATDQSGKVQYLPVSSITDAGLTLSTPELVSEDNSGFTEWYISRINHEEGPTPSAMLDGFQNNYLFWRTLTDSTKERFGQLRHGQSAGVWGRVTAGSLSQGDLTNDYQTYRLGADTSIQPGLSLGAMFEIHEGDLDTSNGKGDMQAITAAIYGLYVSPSGYYADAGFRFGVMDYEYKNTALLYDEYDYNSSAVGAWLEVGKEWTFANNYTLTPHLAVNFGRFGTEHFTSDNGLKAKVDSVNSVIFTVGTDVGYKTETFEVSAVADLMTEVAGSQDIRISHNESSLTRSADYSDTWMEFGLSASYRPTDDTLLWVNGRRSAFADLDNDWRINAGIRWSFY